MAVYSELAPMLRTFSLLTFLLIITALCASCSARPDSALAEPSLDPWLVADVQAVTIPGADDKLSAKLKAELLKVLAESGAARTSSAPPSGEANSIADLSAGPFGDGSIELAWTYLNLGDYDQNGEVNASDLTVVGLFFGSTEESEDWPSAQLADGDSNGEINFADITAIGRNFGSTVVSYTVFSSQSEEDYPQTPGASNGSGASQSGEIVFAQAADSAETGKVFRFLVPVPEEDSYFWVRPADQDGALGAASNYLMIGSENLLPQAIVVAQPTYGAPPLTVNFDASYSWDEDGSIAKFLWDWDGEVFGPADEETGTTSTNSHTYTEDGVYTAWIAVNDDAGGSSFTSVRIEVETWQDSQISDQGADLEVSLEIVGDHPAVCYLAKNRNFRSLYYVRALDERGRSWGEPVEIYEKALKSLNLAVVNGVPAIAFGAKLESVTNVMPYLHYVQALDESGDNWAEPHLVYESSYISDPVLTVADGRPAIGFSSEGDAMFCRATADDGSAWGSPLTIADDASLRSLTLINGNPAVVLIQRTDTVHPTLPIYLAEVRYCRALDSQGSTWGAQIPLALGVSQGDASFGSAQGYPTIVFSYYFDPEQQEALYFRSLDADGGSWDTPISIGPAANAWEFSLLEFEGKPALLFNSSFVQSLDTTGTNWGLPESTGIFLRHPSAAKIVDGAPAVAGTISNGDGEYVPTFTRRYP